MCQGTSGSTSILIIQDQPCVSPTNIYIYQAGRSFHCLALYIHTNAMDSFRDAVHYDSVTSSFLVLAISCFFVFAVLKTWKRVNTSKKRTLKQLPGPPPEPFFGHIRSIPLNAAWITFAEWYKKYGSVTMVRILGRPMVIINTLEAAHNLLEKKGANFSNRPPLLVFREWYVSIFRVYII